MFTYGFYNSVNGDRVYDARDFSRFFDGLILDGVFMNYGKRFFVKTGEEMNIIVESGRAWYKGTWNYNDGDTVIEVENSESVLNRIDALVIDVNISDYARLNELKIIKGTPSSNPSKPILENSELHTQYPIAYITVNKGVTSITQGNIEYVVGTSINPYVATLLQSFDVDELLTQWRSQWTEWFDYVQKETEMWSDEQRRKFLQWVDEQKTNVEVFVREFEDRISNFEKSSQKDFEDWFQNIRDLLEPVDVGSLTNSIYDINEREFEHHYGFMDKTIIIRRTIDGLDEIIESSNEGEITTHIENRGINATINSKFIPNEGNWDYKKTIDIESDNLGGYTIEQRYRKLGKGDNNGL